MTNRTTGAAPRLTWINQLVIFALTAFGKLIEVLLTRTTITGKENFPTEGPALIVANHASTYDAVLMRLHIPREAVFVGPGDFKLALGGTWILKNAGVIMTKRGSIDLPSLKRMEAVLKNGGLLALFPEGGTWEKTLEDVKPGAAYLSAQTGAKIVPMSLGGTYRVWYKILRFQWPRIEIKIDEPLPPVQTSGNRKTRQQELQEASVALMRKIYEMLPPEDQARYDQIARQRYRGHLEAQGAPIQDDTPLDTLAELVAKPNLLAPLKANAPAPLDPLLPSQDGFVPAAEIESAAQALQTLLTGPFAEYLPYRLGDEKTKQVEAQLAAVLDMAATARQNDQQLRFHVHVTEEEAQENSATSS